MMHFFVCSFEGDEFVVGDGGLEGSCEEREERRGWNKRNERENNN